MYQEVHDKIVNYHSNWKSLIFVCANSRRTEGYSNASGISLSSTMSVWIIPSLLFPLLTALMQQSCAPILKCVSVPSSTNSPWHRNTGERKVRHPNIFKYCKCSFSKDQLQDRPKFSRIVHMFNSGKPLYYSFNSWTQLTMNWTSWFFLPICLQKTHTCFHFEATWIKRLGKTIQVWEPMLTMTSKAM